MELSEDPPHTTLLHDGDSHADPGGTTNGKQKKNKLVGGRVFFLGWGVGILPLEQEQERDW